jgi:solute carrier family 29 (equilibrative nucleoside transporter), member 4
MCRLINIFNFRPVLLMFTFNTCDVFGKLFAAIPYAWSRRQLILMSTLRALLIPLLLLCVAPRKNPTISGEFPAFFFTAALGISNGLAGSLPMLLAPQKVAAPLKEMAGNIMTISYMSGLTAGSLVGYVFENMLGPPIAFPCLKYPFIPKTRDEIETTTIIQTTTTQFVPTILSIFTSTLIPTTNEIPTEIPTTFGTFMNASSTLLNNNTTIY